MNFLRGFDLCLITYTLLCMHKMLFWFIICLSTFGNLKSMLHLFQTCSEVEVEVAWGACWRTCSQACVTHWWPALFHKWYLRLSVAMLSLSFYFFSVVISALLLMWLFCFMVSDVALAAVLVPVLVMALTTLILILVCAWHWRNRSVPSLFLWLILGDTQWWGTYPIYIIMEVQYSSPVHLRGQLVPVELQW